MKKTIYKPVVLDKVATVFRDPSLCFRLSLAVSALFSKDIGVHSTKGITYDSKIVERFAGIIDKRRKRAKK